MLSRLLKRIGCACCVGAAVASKLTAADYLVKTWRTDDGLPDTTVTCVQQTHDGYLWLGTPVGLARFDGARFVHFSAINFPELGSSAVVGLFEDRERRLWIATESGRLVSWRHGVARIHVADGKSGRDTVVAMAQNASGTLWLQTADGRLGRLSADAVDYVTQAGPALRRTHFALAVDGRDTLWVGTRDGLRVWENGALQQPAELGVVGSRPVDAIAPASSNGLWVYADHRLWEIRDRRVGAEKTGPSHFTGSAVALVEGSEKRPWIAAEGGRLYYLDGTDSWRVITTQMGLRNANLALYRDRENNLWRGSAGGGLTRLRPNVFSLHERPAMDPDRRAPSVSADPAGNVWALLNSRSLASVAAETHEIRFWGTRQETNTSRVIYSDRAGRVWSGSPQRRVFRLSDGVLSPAFMVDRDARGINAFFEDAAGNLWIGYSGGAGAGYLEGGEVGRWRPAQGLPFPDVCAIGQAADGSMWFGTSRGGACRLHKGDWTQFSTRNGLPSDIVRCFQMDSDGTVWMGTLQGIARWRNGKISRVTSEQGLWNDTVYHIADDQRGNLWMSSPGGIFHVERERLHECADGILSSIRCVGYNRNDGLAAQECSGGVQPAGARTPDGRLWFPTADGIVSVDPARIYNNPHPPPVLIEEIDIEGKSRSLNSDDALIQVPAGRNRIGFRFTALSLTSPDKVRFRYRLEGVDHDWSPPDDQRSAVYRFVPPGQYVFRVIACNNAGVWSPVAASLALVVKPFFWQTAWFRVGLAMAVVAGVAWVVRGRERRKARLVLERMERQHAVERERARIAKDIHDDIGASLTQIALLSERVDGALRDPADVQRWNKRISQTAENTIRSLDEIVWAVNPKDDTLESLANYLGRFAHEHLDLAGISCRLDIPTVLEPVEVSAESRHNLLLATREALQNVVRHASATEVRVSLEMRDEGLDIRIADNGRGLAVDVPGAGGNGVPNMRRRMEEIGGRFEVNSTPGKGTEIRLGLSRERLLPAGRDATLCEGARTPQSPKPVT